MLYDAQSQFERAEPYYRRALELREKSNGPESLEAARSLNNLGEMYTAKRQYEKAEPLLKHAYAIRSTKLPKEDPQVRQTMRNLAITYAALGQIPLAEQFADGQVIEGLNLKLLSAPQSPGRGSDKK